MSAYPKTSRVEPTNHQDIATTPANAVRNLYAAPSVRVTDSDEPVRNVPRTGPTIAQRIVFLLIAAYSALMVAMVGYFFARQLATTTTLPSLLGKLFGLWIVCSAYFYPLRSVWRAIKGSLNGSRNGALKACGLVVGSLALFVACGKVLDPQGEVLNVALGFVIMTIPHIVAILMLCFSRVPDPRRLRWIEPSEHFPH
ncbi:hypothetical protein [Niveibacterium umoris]|uniref:Uncharacterized protein n=1 Tax=Niveibacterium umoris TaxID=1193620 RepID=A0A840BUK7_9RHOO|nr:hypothetical protein [Niveibacterium umoris]MBB4014037.1 hypothetical protein [Niveibacterium umoris]